MPTTITQGVDLGFGIVSAGLADWSDLGSSPYASWSNWTIWNPEPQDIIVEIQEDLGSKSLRTPQLAYEAQGAVTLVLEIADTVDSSDSLVSPTTINIVDDGTEYDYVAGRHYKVTITVTTDADTAVPLLLSPRFTTAQNYQFEYQSDVDTSTLTGDFNAGLTVDNSLGVVDHVLMTATPYTYCEELTGVYWEDVYVAPLAASANWRSKNPLKITTSGQSGSNTVQSHTFVDIQIRGLPLITQTSTGIE